MTTPSNPKRSPVPFVAADGVECLRVPLAGNRGSAEISARASNIKADAHYPPGPAPGHHGKAEGRSQAGA